MAFLNTDKLTALLKDRLASKFK